MDGWMDGWANHFDPTFQLCFYNEKVEIHIDGVKQEQAKSKFS